MEDCRTSDFDAVPRLSASLHRLRSDLSFGKTATTRKLCCKFSAGTDAIEIILLPERNRKELPLPRAKRTGNKWRRSQDEDERVAGARKF